MEKNYGDKNIFVVAYDQYNDAIFRYCVFKIFNRERAKEIMQETFTKTWEYLCRGNQIHNMKAFLYRVAHNLCVNEVIRHKAYSLDEMNEKIGFEVADDTLPSAESETEFALLMQNLQKLKSKERELLIMKYLDDLKINEIAEIFGMLPNTISVKIIRAEKKLRRIYKKNEK